MINLLVSSSTCSDYALAGTLSTIRQVFQILCIVVPIILILSMIFSFLGFVINPDTKGKGKKVVQKVAAAIIIFIIPSFVNLTMGLIDTAGTNFDMDFSIASCWNYADSSAEGIEAATYYSGSGTTSTKSGLFSDLSGLRNYGVSSSTKFSSTEIIKYAKEIADYVRDHNFRYGDAPVNPAMNHDARIISCDRFVGWVLYKLGYTDQPRTQGLTVNNMPKYLVDHGFKKYTNYDEMRETDIIFFDYNKNGAMDHTFILGAKGSNGQWYRYDCGHVSRIRSTQPWLEPVSKTNFAYGFHFP